MDIYLLLESVPLLLFLHVSDISLPFSLPLLFRLHLEGSLRIIEVLMEVWQDDPGRKACPAFLMFPRVWIVTGTSILKKWLINTSSDVQTALTSMWQMKHFNLLTFSIPAPRYGESSHVGISRVLGWNECPVRVMQFLWARASDERNV